MALNVVLTEEEFTGLKNEALTKESLFKLGDDGRYYSTFAAVDGWAVEDVGGLKKSLREANKRLDGAEDKLKVFGDLDPTRARDAIKKVGDLKNYTASDKVDEIVRNKLIEVNDAHAKEKGTWEERETKLLKGLKKAIVGNDVSAALVDLRVKDRYRKITKRMLTESADAEEVNGEYRTRIYKQDKDGNRVLETNAAGDPASIFDVGDKMKKSKDYADMFEGPGVSGTGAKGSTTTPSSGGRIQITEEQAKDPRQYAAAKEAAIASKTGQEIPDVIPG